MAFLLVCHGNFGREADADSIEVAPARPVVIYSSAPGWQSPIHGGRITTPYGKRGPMWHWKGYHTGDDYAAGAGTPILAARNGVVIESGWISSAYGYGVKIRHSRGLTTLYAHASSVDVRRGDRVRTGQHIGNVGSSGNATGPHLHFEVRRHNDPVSPIGFTRGVKRMVFPRFKARALVLPGAWQ